MQDNTDTDRTQIHHATTFPSSHYILSREQLNPTVCAATTTNTN